MRLHQNQKKIKLRSTVLIVVLIVFFINLGAVQCAQNYKDQKQQTKIQFDFQTQFTSKEFIENMTRQAANISFTSIRQKYLFIYNNHIDFCLEQIGDQFEPYVKAAITPAIKLVGIGITKVIASKIGVLGALKVLGVTVGGMTALPLVGIAGATWLYSTYRIEQLKQTCRLMMQKMQGEIYKQEGELLIKIQENYKILQQKFERSKEMQRRVQKTDKKQQAINKQIQKHQSTIKILTQYFQFLKIVD